MSDKQVENGVASAQNGSQVGKAPSDSHVDRPLFVRSTTPGGHALDTSEPAFPNYHRKFGNPTPLGLFGFATTLFLLSMINVNTRGLQGKTNFMTCTAASYGGLTLVLSSMWAFVEGSTFAATVFCSYGSFWLSYALMQIPWFNVMTGYSVAEANAMVGIWLAAWTMVSLFFMIACLRSSIALVTLFFFVVIALALLTAASFKADMTLQKAGGIFGLISAFVGYYTALCGLMTPESTLFTLPPGNLSPA